MSDNKDEMQVDLDTITSMANRLVKKGKLKEAEIAGYIHEHMTGLGYKSKRTYYQEDKGAGGGSSSFSFFGRGSSSGDDD